MLKSLAMTETLDTYTMGTSPEDFAQADMPPDVPGDDADDAAPWGYTTDPVTKERRPKKAPGRPKVQPGADELAKEPPIERPPDEPPVRPPGRKLVPVTPAAEGDVPMPRGGVIAKGVNKLYRRAGKILRGFEGGDPMGIGQALIECTRTDPDAPEDERELTVGEAWEQLARNNPRVRAWIMKAIAGGDIWDLVMAHAPIGIALAMKPWVQRMIPFGALVESLTEEDDDEEDGTALGGLRKEDLQQMQDLTADQARQVARKTAAGMGIHVSEADLDRAMKQAESKLPAGFTRQQPKNRSRAQRAGSK